MRFDIEEQEFAEKTSPKKQIKDQRMNIRINKDDLEGIKAKAAEEGLPYQTLVTSIIHKYVSGKLIEKRDHSKRLRPE